MSENISKSFKNVAAAEADMRKSLPAVLYKYRDWNNQFHRTSLTVPEVYYSHPKN